MRLRSVKSLTRHVVKAHPSYPDECHPAINQSVVSNVLSSSSATRITNIHSEVARGWRDPWQTSLLSRTLDKLTLLTNLPNSVEVQCRRHFHSFDSRNFGSVSLLEVKKFLRQKGIKYEESHACLVINIGKHHLVSSSAISAYSRCVWQNVDASMTVIYINKKTGSFVCPELALYGEWSHFQAFLVNYARTRSSSISSTPDIAGSTPLPMVDLPSLHAMIQQRWNDAHPVESLSGQDFKELLKQFSLSRELQPQDFAFHQVRFTRCEESGRFELLFPVRYPLYDQIIGLKRVSYDPELKTICEENLPTAKELNKAGGLPGVCQLMPFMYGTEKCQKSESVVIVSSVLDALSLTSKNLSVIALAEGPGLLPPEHLPFFEDFNDIIFWLPNDPASADNVSVFGKKLDEKRCRYVTRDIDQPSTYLRRKPKTSIREVIKSHTKPCAHEHITTFDSLREDVFLEFAQFEETEGVKFKRFDGLNDLLRGFRRGELTVFTGRTGAGKTTFISEYSLDLAAQNVNTLWGSFEVKNVRLAKTQLRQFSGVNMEENLESFDYWADKFSKLPLYYLTFHGASEVDKVLDAMGYAIYLFDIAHVIIDNLQFMLGSEPIGMDRFHAQDQVISKFRKFATLHNVHMTLVIHPRKEDGEMLTTNSIFGGAKATQEADNVMLLQEEEVGAKGLKRKFIQVAKNRYSGDLGILPLFFNKGTSTFSKKIYNRDRAHAKQQRALKMQQQDLAAAAASSKGSQQDSALS